jgi:hypothetical protein
LLTFGIIDLTQELKIVGATRALNTKQRNVIHPIKVQLATKFQELFEEHLIPSVL